VGDEQIAEAALNLKVLQQIEDLGLDGKIKRTNCFITDHKPGRENESTSDRYSLSLAA